MLKIFIVVCLTGLIGFMCLAALINWAFKSLGNWFKNLLGIKG